jgi:hypothetical protein
MVGLIYVKNPWSYGSNLSKNLLRRVTLDLMHLVGSRHGCETRPRCASNFSPVEVAVTNVLIAADGASKRAGWAPRAAHAMGVRRAVRNLRQATLRMNERGST